MSLKCKSDNVTEGEGGGSGKMPRPGRYHFAVESWEVKDGARGRKLNIKSVVLAGNPKNPADGDQVGRTMTHFFSPDSTAEGAQNALRLFTIATGLATDEDWMQAKARGEDVDIPIEDVKGRQFCAEIEDRPGTGDKADKLYPDAGWSYLSPLHEKTKDIQKDQEWLSLLGAPVSNPAAPQPPQASSQSTQQAQQPVAAGNGSVWDAFK